MGEDKIVNDLFNKMVSEGIEPNVVTFNVILNACSHQGLLEKGQMYFEIMSMRYGVIPSLEHHTCMMVSYGCAGQLKRAMESFNMMSSFDFPTVWLPLLLGVCRKWGVEELGTLAFNEAIHLDNSCASG